jgi:lipid-binding SYLF domain-containing protein
MLGLVVLGLGFSGCSTAPQTTDDKASLSEDAGTALKRLNREDPELQKFIDKAYGYALFPSVGKGAVGIGGAYGRGELYEKGVLGFKMTGFAVLEQATIGFQLGGQTYSELIAFESKSALERFQSGNFAFSANASAIALKAGASATAKYENGVAVFTMPNGGLMFEASVGGQKFKYQAK